MEKNEVTLKQIAQEVGVSITTVHRALNGKEGCSDELKERIFKVARDLGYSVNLAASSMRRKSLHFALLFPEYDKHTKYFIQKIKEGYLTYREDVSRFNIVFSEIYFNGDNYEQKLMDIYKDHPIRYDGLVMYALPTKFAAKMLNKLSGKGIHVVLLDREIPCADYTCCVKPNDIMSGKMAGEMLCKMTHKSGNVLILSTDYGTSIDGSFSDENCQSCMNEIATTRPDLSVEYLTLPTWNPDLNWLTEQLRQGKEYVAIYATNARNTALMISFLRENKQSNDMIAIGSDVFEQSLTALKDGVLDILIDKQPYQIGYKALKILFSRVLKGEKYPHLMTIVPRIVLKSNFTNDMEF